MAHFCPVCGNDFNPYTKGRTKTYCGDFCRDYSKFKTALENCILNINATSEASSLIRGDMFRLANLLSSGTKSSNTKQTILKDIND